MMRFVVPLLLVFLSACQTVHTEGGPDENSAYFKVPVNSKLILNQLLTVPAKKGRVYFQFGRTRTFYEVNPYRPYCELKMQTKSTVPQSIRPAEFTVHQVSREMRFTVAGKLIRLAGDPETMEWLVIATVMDLRSETESDVSRLTCASWGLPQTASHLTIRRIRATLGDIFTLELVHNSSDGKALQRPVPLAFASAR